MITLVSTITVGSGGAASIQFTGIPQTGKDLMLMLSIRASSSTAAATLTFNNTNAPSRVLHGDGSSVFSYGPADGFGALYIPISNSGNTSNTFGSANVLVANYASTTSHKSISSDGVSENNAIAAVQQIGASTIPANTAVTSILINTSVAQHSTASLYIVS